MGKVTNQIICQSKGSHQSTVLLGDWEGHSSHANIMSLIIRPNEEIRDYVLISRSVCPQQGEAGSRVFPCEPWSQFHPACKHKSLHHTAMPTGHYANTMEWDQPFTVHGGFIRVESGHKLFIWNLFNWRDPSYYIVKWQWSTVWECDVSMMSAWCQYDVSMMSVWCRSIHWHAVQRDMGPVLSKVVDFVPSDN